MTVDTGVACGAHPAPDVESPAEPATSETKAGAVETAALCPRCGELQARIRELEAQLTDAAKCRSDHEAEIERLRALVETHQRAGKRQSAPFSKGPPKTKPARPGRKRGSSYGRKGHRKPPPTVDEVHEAKLPPSCPKCGGRVEKERDALQYQVDLPKPQPIHRQIVVEIGNCVESDCGARVQGRHPLQTSDALGAAASQLGPRVQAVVAKLRTDLGTSFGNLRRVLAEEFGIQVTRGGLCQAVQRVGRKLDPSYDELKQQVQSAPYASLDETGWRVAARSAWLWVAATATISFYAILPGRGFAQATALLDKAYRGFLGRDGWAAYRGFVEAIHQTCLPHLLRRCHKILETARDGEAGFPQQVKALLQRALALRDRRDADDISPHGFAVARGKIIAAMTRLADRKPEVPEVEANRKLAKHLRNELPALFTFLHHRGVAAANWLAEQELRIPIAIRKACGGGNRTWTGAKAFARIATVVRTARRRSLDPTVVIIGVLCSRRPVVAGELAAPTPAAQPSADSEPRPPP